MNFLRFEALRMTAADFAFVVHRKVLLKGLLRKFNRGRLGGRIECRASLWLKSSPR